MSNRGRRGRGPGKPNNQVKIQEFARGIVDLILAQAEVRHKDNNHLGQFYACENASCLRVRDQSVKLYDLIKGLVDPISQISKVRIADTSELVEKDHVMLHGLVSTRLKAELHPGPSPKQLAAWGTAER